MAPPPPLPPPLLLLLLRSLVAHTLTASLSRECTRFEASHGVHRRVSQTPDISFALNTTRRLMDDVVSFVSLFASLCFVEATICKCITVVTC